MDKKTKTYLVHLGLFLATLVTTTIAGAEWMYGKFLIGTGLTWNEILNGLYFSIPFLLIFTFHEFGHYFTARKNNVSTSLPYYIPLPPILPGMIGTLGAVIRLKERVQSARKNFDIGIAGPLAGFVIAMMTLWYGYTHLPEPDYIYQVHPEYAYFGDDYPEFVYGADTIVTKSMLKDFLTPEELALRPDTVISPEYGSFLQVDKTLMIQFFEKYVVPEGDKYKIPNGYELVHYPFLFAGFLALFFTALNLLPIGQFDGGHITYGLFGGKGHTIIANVVFFGLLLYGGLGLIDLHTPIEDIILKEAAYLLFLNYVLKATKLQKKDRWMYAVIIFSFHFLLSMWNPLLEGSVLMLAIAMMVRLFIGVEHPPSEIEEKLDTNRVILGWISLLILVLCFSPAPLG